MDEQSEKIKEIGEGWDKQSQPIYRLTFLDAERQALEEAIKVYKDFIEDKIGDRIEAPYWARLQAIKRLEEKLNKI